VDCSQARPGQIPVVILHEAGQRYDESLVLLHLDWLMELLGISAGGGKDNGRAD